MQYSLFILASAAVALVCAAPFKRDVDPALVPEFGVTAGVNQQTQGIAMESKILLGKLSKSPVFAHQTGPSSFSVTFPTDDSTASQLARLQTAIVTLQNLNGTGKGCPAASTTFLAQQQAIMNGATSSSTPPPSTTSTPAPASTGVDVSLVPPFGHAAGLNPTGTGDCDGITNSAGQVIEVPCSCPPDRDSFIASLNANVAAGHAVNNPSIPVTFPTDDSNASKAARIEAALVTLQNLNGPGVGCPAASTTFSAQLAAVQG
ncbi:hypothetical protein H0H92_002504 [Tricholoma furcatifolium]|nr:hypothetical protein H0H92_002504 [Tricholoma furcatifolium]